MCSQRLLLGNMNKLQLLFKIFKCQTAFYSCTNRMCIEKLKQRTVLKLSGKDTQTYLQSMITNDVKRVENLPSLYSLLLNPQGRVLYDIILYKINGNEYLVEYDSTAVQYLQKHLLMYRLRKDVKIQPLDSLSSWVLYSDIGHSPDDKPLFVAAIQDHLKNDAIIASVDDPRNNHLGVRIITENDFELQKHMEASGLNLSDEKSFRIHRYKLGIGEGVLDHPTGNCLPFETNVDFLNGVSFTKGCYIGQELTARAHFVLNVRKRLMPITLQPSDSYPDFPPECDILNDKGHKVGRLRSHAGSHGLALMKYEETTKCTEFRLQGFDIGLKPTWPNWWPKDLRNMKSL